jgi:hypothetical protein
MYIKNTNIDLNLALENKSHQDVVKSIRKADILIDQMVAGWYGLIHRVNGIG